jgi:hypothetical protein
MQQEIYQITVKGHLNPNWAEWFNASPCFFVRLCCSERKSLMTLSCASLRLNLADLLSLTVLVFLNLVVV